MMMSLILVIVNWMFRLVPVMVKVHVLFWVLFSRVMVVLNVLLRSLRPSSFFFIMWPARSAGTEYVSVQCGGVVGVCGCVLLVAAGL